jgi:transposase
MASLQTTAPTISRWKQQFEEGGIAGLDLLHKGSRPRMANASMQAKVVRKTQQKPADGSAYWSCRKMAEALGVSKSTVPRVRAQTRLKPHRLERYMVSNDPLFEQKPPTTLRSMNPSQHAAAFCVDERRPCKRLIGLTRGCRCRPGAPNGTGSNTIATERFPFVRHSTWGPASCVA